MDNDKILKKRDILRVVIEATTPIAVSAGEKDVETDARVMRDANRLPYIPATSLAGILRHALGKAGEQCDLWGYQSADGGRGSRLMFTNANLVRHDGTVADGLLDIDLQADEFLRHYLDLPIRQHVRIGHHGAAERHGKFDQEVVYAGSRFCFELEVAHGGEAASPIDDIVAALQSPTLRIGGSVYSGLGEFRVVTLQRAALDLTDQSDLARYLGKSSSLDNASWWTVEPNKAQQAPVDSEGWQRYDITLRPDDFFVIGSGMGDDQADITPVAEQRVEWGTDGTGRFTDAMLLIPATSVKGALAHRVAYHYNRLSGVFADRLPDDMTAADYVGNMNTAVRALFGYELDGTTCPGHTMFSDVFLTPAGTTVFNHVRIDRFTGGAMDGGLFNEKVAAGQPEFGLTIWVDKAAFCVPNVQQALEAAIGDLVTGMLPLGGAVNRGHGTFTGHYTTPNSLTANP